MALRPVVDVGQRLGRCRLVAPVGRGGMATVWCAQAEPAGDLVAVKVMHPALGADPRFEKMFLAEGVISASLAHPNICAIVEAGEADGLLYLVMEWVDGGSLSGLSESHGALPFDVAARIVADVARGLHAAHEARVGLVHRDVSPQNVLLSTSGDAKIADFGIAWIEGAPVTQAGFVKGKVRYMAPEQVYCEPVDRRTDVFALGVVLYEATTGVHPFAKPTDVATLASIAAADEARPPRDLVDGYPVALERVVMRALAKDPAARFATMDALATAIDDVSHGTREEVAAFVREASAARLEEQNAAIARAVAAAPSRGRAQHALLAAVGLVAAASLAFVLGTNRSDVKREPAPPTPAATAALAVVDEPTAAPSTETTPPPIVVGATPPKRPSARIVAAPRASASSVAAASAQPAPSTRAFSVLGTRE